MTGRRVGWTRVALIGLAVGLCACETMYPVGVFYDGTTTPSGMMRINGDGANKGATKHGEACATGILGVAAWGDASVEAAKEAGGLKEVFSVEFHNNYFVLGIYHEACTVAWGN